MAPTGTEEIQDPKSGTQLIQDPYFRTRKRVYVRTIAVNEMVPYDTKLDDLRPEAGFSWQAGIPN